MINTIAEKTRQEGEMAKRIIDQLAVQPFCFLLVIGYHPSIMFLLIYTDFTSIDMFYTITPSF